MSHDLTLEDGEYVMLIDASNKGATASASCQHLLGKVARSQGLTTKGYLRVYFLHDESRKELWPWRFRHAYLDEYNHVWS